MQANKAFERKVIKTAVKNGAVKTRRIPLNYYTQHILRVLKDGQVHEKDDFDSSIPSTDFTYLVVNGAIQRSGNRYRITPTGRTAINEYDAKSKSFKALKALVSFQPISVRQFIPILKRATYTSSRISLNPSLNQTPQIMVNGKPGDGRGKVIMQFKGGDRNRKQLLAQVPQLEWFRDNLYAMQNDPSLIAKARELGATIARNPSSLVGYELTDWNTSDIEDRKTIVGWYLQRHG